MIATRAYSELLDSLYASTVDEGQLAVFLDQLVEATDSVVAFFLRNSSTLGSRKLASGGMPIPQETDRWYEEGQSYADPIRQGFMRNPRVGVVEVEDLLPRKELTDSAAYQEMMAPAKLEYGTCIVPAISARSYEVFSLWRTTRPYLAPDHRELLDLLFPHLENVLRIRRTLGLAEDRARNAEAMLDATTTASILLNASGKILHMNEAAQVLALAADGFRVAADRLVPTDGSMQRAFAAAVAAVSTADLRIPGESFLLARKGRKRALQVLVSPIRLQAQHRSPARVLVLATDPSQPIAFPDAVLRQIYGFTRSETEIANGLLTGFSIEEIATLRQVSPATVRSQLKAVLSKTQTRRQSDLVRLLLSLPRRAPEVGSGSR